ncbi:MAG TPA: TetR/AcrR family transcriptional regulator [Thermomonospora sp.]|nr:TetR/AcrR family transcriptional regulator [Thermomonospora sp.]
MARPRATSDEALLRAAGRALGRLGPAGVTLASVAGEAGVSPATLVQRFGSKRGLLLAVAGRAVPSTAEVFRTVRQEHDSPLQALHAALAELASSVRTPQEMANSLAFLQLDLTDPDFREHAVAQARCMREGVAGLLSDAVAAGELTPDADTERLARSVQVTYNGVLITWALSGEGSLTGVLREYIDDLLSAYRP